MVWPFLITDLDYETFTVVFYDTVNESLDHRLTFKIPFKEAKPYIIEKTWKKNYR